MDTKSRQEALRLTKRLVDLLEGDPMLVQAARKLWDSLQLMPMDKILAMVPGESVSARARHIGITREAYYHWLRGSRRPDRRCAQRLSEITGVPAAMIMGARG